MSDSIAGSGCQRPCREHVFITDLENVRQMEVSLIRLLNDFNEGRLRAFDVDNSFESLDAAREMQEGLSDRHFQMDAKLEQLDRDAPHQDRVPSLQSKDGQRIMKEETGEVMRKLRDLSLKIQSLHKARPPGGASGIN